MCTSPYAAPLLPIYIAHWKSSRTADNKIYSAKEYLLQAQVIHTLEKQQLI